MQEIYIFKYLKHSETKENQKLSEKNKEQITEKNLLEGVILVKHLFERESIFLILDGRKEGIYRDCVIFPSRNVALVEKKKSS